jgi:hypothetical protein
MYTFFVSCGFYTLVEKKRRILMDPQAAMYLIYGTVFLTMIGILVAAEWGKKKRKEHHRPSH